MLLSVDLHEYFIDKESITILLDGLILTFAQIEVQTYCTIGELLRSSPVCRVVTSNLRYHDGLG